MSEFDDQLKRLLSTEDEKFVSESLTESGYYKEAYGSLKGIGKGNTILCIGGVSIFCSVLFFAIWGFFQADTVKYQILFASLAVMANSAQIAVKHWFNMYVHRRAIIREIKRLQLAVVHADDN